MNKFIFFAVCALAVLAITDAIPTCGLGELFQTCGTACPEHCPVRNTRTGELETGANQPCTKNCVQGCFCAPGRVRDLKRNGECVEKFTCTPADIDVITPFSAAVAEEPKCGHNEVYLTCGTACPQTCPFRNAKTGQIEDGTPKTCVHMCKIGCACAHGFVRDLKKSNACVEKALCSAP